MANGSTITIDNLVDMETTLDYDNVNNPAHYNLGDGIECIDYINQTQTLEQFVGYCDGNVKKYMHRKNYKGNRLEDAKKAQWYMNKLVETLEEIHK